MSFNSDVAEGVAGNVLRERRLAGKCPFCGKAIRGSFRDALSDREYQISGLCQACQDETFGDCYDGCGH